MDRGIYEELLDSKSPRYGGESDVLLGRAFHKMVLRNGFDSERRILVKEGRASRSLRCSGRWKGGVSFETAGNNICYFYHLSHNYRGSDRMRKR